MVFPYGFIVQTVEGIVLYPKAFSVFVYFLVNGFGLTAYNCQKAEEYE